MDKTTVCNTSDGSMTYIDPLSGQTMHAKEGAFSETVYIYGESFEFASQSRDNLRVIIFGLGLGYIELINLAQAIKSKKTIETLVSLEKEDHLIDSFRNWLLKDEKNKLSGIYENIISRLEKLWGINPAEIVDLGKALITENRWHFQGDPTQQVSWKNYCPFHVIQYDPYSRSANPEVWSLDWLNDFLRTASADLCVFATYASTGPLKKALSQNEFILKPKSGFGLKRESTLAIRDTQKS